MKKIIYFIAIVLIGVQACDKIDDPIPEDAGTSIGGGDLEDDEVIERPDTLSNGDTLKPSDTLMPQIEFVIDPQFDIKNTNELVDFIFTRNWDTVSGANNTTQRFIVLEEFTGHTCKACPEGARKIADLKNIYGNQLIPIAIHASDQFAAPANSGNQFRTDFRVRGGHHETYRLDFGIQALPQGIVSRSTNSGRQINQWEGDIQAIANETPIAKVLVTNFHSSTDTIARVRIEVEWLVTTSQEYNLQVQLLESNIIDWQLDGNDVKSDYNHKHVLRKVVNGTYGKVLKPAILGDIEIIEYITSYNENWEPLNMESVVFIFNSDPNSYEIMQGNSAYLKK